jgi:hypothetical protein
MQIKFVIFNTNGTGVARFDYDQVTGLPSVAADDADFDSDGDVDGQDFLIWQRNVSVGATQQSGDANNSGAVDSADLAVWRTQFGLAGPAVPFASSVPEPATVGIVLVAGSALLCARKSCMA